MTDLNRLPPDQRAVLSLVLDRGKSYSQVADMLAIPESAVRDRAHAALDALAGTTGAARAGERSARGDDVSSGARSGVAGGIGGSVAGGIGGSRLRGAGGRPPDTGGEPRSPRDVRQGASSRPARPASSRRNGALLLAVIAIAIVVAVILIAGGGKGSSDKNTVSKNTAPTNSTSSTSTGTTGKPKLDKTIKLAPVEASLKAQGEAYVLSESGRRAFYVAIQGLTAPSDGSFYAVWLYTSPSRAAPLGRAPANSSNGRIEGGGPLPTNAASYQQLIITRETSTHPSKPGPIVLRGAFAVR